MPPVPKPPVPKPPITVKQRERLKGRPHRIPDSVKLAMFTRWGTVCHWCRQPGGALDAHHVQRRSQGGKDHEDNLRPLHRKCHRYVHEHPTEAKQRGFLR